MAAVKFSKQGVQPNPIEVDYWVDIKSDPYGSVWKYFNGADWVDFSLGKGSGGGGMYPFDYYTKVQVNQLLNNKLDVKSDLYQPFLLEGSNIKIDRNTNTISAVGELSVDWDTIPNVPNNLVTSISTENEVINVDETFTTQVLRKNEQTLTEEEKAQVRSNIGEDRIDTGGMNHIVLRRDLSFSEQVTKENTIYEIRHNFDLNEEEVTIPEGCILDFQGGSFSNGTIVGNDTTIQASLVRIFELNVNLSGSWKVQYVYPEWMGARGDGVTDDSDCISKSIELSYVVNKPVFITGVYLISNDIEINLGLRFFGTYIHSDSYQFRNNSCLLVKDCNGFILNGISSIDSPNKIGSDIIFENVSLKSDYRADFIHTHCAGRPPRLARFKNCNIEYFKSFITLHNDGNDTSWGIMEFDNCLMYHNYCVLKTDSAQQSHRTITNLIVHNCNISSLNSENPVFDLQHVYGPITITNCIAESLGCLLKVTNASVTNIEISKNYFEGIRGYIVDISSKSVKRNSFKFIDNSIHMTSENIRLKVYLFKIIDFSGNIYYNTSNEYDDTWNMTIYGCEIGCNIPYYSFSSSYNFFSLPFKETSLLPKNTMFIPTSNSYLSNGCIGYKNSMTSAGTRAIAFYANKDIPAGSKVLVTGWKKGGIAITIKDSNRTNNIFPKIQLSAFADFFAESVTTLQTIEKGQQYSLSLDLEIGNIELSGLCIHVFASDEAHSLNKYLIFNKKNWIDGLSGPSSERPMLFNTGNGQKYYDTDLGKLIYFYDSWKDATGATV